MIPTFTIRQDVYQNLPRAVLDRNFEGDGGQYLLPRRDAAATRLSLDDIADLISPVLMISEVRTVAADDLWISPSYRSDSVAFHFTRIPDDAAVLPVVKAIEKRSLPSARGRTEARSSPPRRLCSMASIRGCPTSGTSC